jgi:hypothetical protein
MPDQKNASLRKMLCSFPEAGEIFDGFSRDTLVTEVHEGRLHPVRIGKRDYLHRIEVERRRDEILATLTAPTPAPAPTAPTDPADAMRQLAEECA